MALCWFVYDDMYFCIHRSMLPDVIDEFMIVTGERKDAIFYSFYVFFNKLAAGLGLGISQVALQLVTSVCSSSVSQNLFSRVFLRLEGTILRVMFKLETLEINKYS